MAHDLPLIVAWLLASCFMALLATQAGVWFAARPFHRATQEPWYERARLAQPARLVIGLSFVPLIIGSAMSSLILEQDLSITHPHVFEFAGIGGVILALVLASRLLSSKVRRQSKAFKSALASMSISWLIYFAQVSIALALVIANAGEFGWWTVAVMAIGFCVIAFLWSGGTLKILLFLGLARPAEPRLANIVQQSAQSLGMPVPPCYQLRWQAVNALAFPVIGSVAFSDAAVQCLDDQQLYAICLHELAHLAEPRSVLVLRSVSSLLLYFYVIAILFAARFGMSGILIAVTLFLFARIAISKLSRKWERDADAVAGANQDQGLNYAYALLRIYEANMLPLVGMFQGGNHPHGYDRLVAAGLQPEFARPAAPSRSTLFVGFILASLVAFFLYFSVTLASRIIADHRQSAQATTQSE